MNYREQRAYLNCEKRIFPGVGGFDFPEIEPVDVDVEGAELVGFNYALDCKNPEDKICHFYLDDYQFERVWSSPERYVPILKRFKAVLSPDFSMYTDFPRAVQVFNKYRGMWCAAYWQENGITVIPSVCWSDEQSFVWCFDGLPCGSVVSVSTVGGFGNHEDNNRAAWLAGFNRCMSVLRPSCVLLFGKLYPEIQASEDCKIVVAGNHNLERKKLLSAE